ncbi:unnamed protein product [Adineta steineri]|uniref:Fatty acid desaturase domain-containing protein n=1 Tax=Adineta steineri TaxID=433720 RepID=A0A819M926_9BILA|nr:unnamed protein product [Adineta steineri]
MDKDEAFYPLRGETYKESRMTNIILWVPGLVWFYYLICGYSPRFVSHFNPFELIFDKQKIKISISLGIYAAMLYLMFIYTTHMGIISLMVYHLIPVLVFATYLVIVTLLHHTEMDVPWFDNSEWNHVKGQLSTVDRHYGHVHSIIHSIGTHQIHHLFPKIPHYHLEEATAHFRKAFPNLVRVNYDRILPSFVRMSKTFVLQRCIGNDVEVCFIQYAKIKEHIEERIKKHYQWEKAARYLYNSEKEVDVNELLTSLDELSARPGSDKRSCQQLLRTCNYFHWMIKTLIERHTTQPSFLTERDFKDGTLECKKVTNKPAVYAVTICIPDWLYASMKADPKLCNLQVLKTASFDGMGSVYLRGKIGETNGFQRRVRKYNSNDESSGLGSVFCYLRKEAKESKAEFTDWVKVWPILSGECLQDTEERIKMETRCSFLLGRDGNSGYNRL